MPLPSPAVRLRGSALALLLAAPLASAQTAGTIPLPEAPAAAAPATQAGEPATQLEDIVVTAQKKVQNLQQVPVSVGVVSAETLAESGTYDATGLENFVANVEIDTDPQAPVIGVRGFWTETDNVGFEPSVGLVLDEVSLGRPEFVPDGLYDLDRVEVLRGSQGTLFGKNTIAGVINFMSTEPAPEFGGYLNLTGGDPGLRRGEAALNLPLAENLAARVSGVYWDKQGDVDNGTLGRRENSFSQRAGRLRVLATPGDWTVDLEGQLSNTSVDYSANQLYAADPDALAYARSWDSSAEDRGLDAHMNANLPGYVQRNSDLTRAKLTYDLGDLGPLRGVSLTAVGGQAGFNLDTWFDTDTSAADLINTDFDVLYRQNSLELRPAGTADSLFGLGGEVQWTLGVYGYRAEMESHLDSWAGDNLLDFAASSAGLEALGLPRILLLADLLDALPNLPAIPFRDALLRGYRQSTRSYAVFGQVDWKLTGHVSAILGLRAGQEDKEAWFDTQNVGPGIVGLVVGASPFTTHRERSESELSPKLGLQYQWTPRLMSFVSVTRGFKGGGFNATANDDTNLEFEPEKATAWELGWKSRLLENTLMLNVTLYRTEVDNLQVVDNQGVTFEISNAAKALLQGVELESQWRPAAWFDLGASVAYCEARYQQYRNAPASNETGGDSQDLSGRTLANAPNITGTLSPTLSLPLGGLGLRLGSTLSWRGEQYSAVDLDSHSFQDGYLLVGARIILAPMEGHWAIVLNGNNLTDERALDLVFDHAVFANTYVAQQIPLRSFSATLRFDF